MSGSILVRTDGYMYSGIIRLVGNGIGKKGGRAGLEIRFSLIENGQIGLKSK